MAVVAVAAAAAFVHSPARADVIAFPEPMADAITELAAPGYGATPAEPGSQVWDIPPGADFAAAPVSGPLTTLAGAPLGTVTMYQPANGWVITGVMRDGVAFTVTTTTNDATGTLTMSGAVARGGTMEKSVVITVTATPNGIGRTTEVYDANGQLRSRSYVEYPGPLKEDSLLKKLLDADGDGSGGAPSDGIGGNDGGDQLAAVPDGGSGPDIGQDSSPSPGSCDWYDCDLGMFDKVSG